MADLTALLQAHGRGDAEALERLVPLVYDDLRRLARSQARRAGAPESLNATGLVHEAYLRLAAQSRAQWRDRGHFFAVCAVAMRQILVDHARARTRRKRGGSAERVPIDEGVAFGESPQQLLELDLALSRLGEVDRRLVRVVECRYFAGYSEADTAEALGISLRTAQRDWLKARAWLRQELAHA